VEFISSTAKSLLLRRWLSTRDREQGFTVIEILTVLTLAAIVLTLAVPRVSGLLDRLRLDTATAGLTAELHVARAAAQARGEPYEVFFYSDRYMVLVRGVPLHETLLPPGITIDSAGSVLVVSFSRHGSSSGGFVRLRNRMSSRTVVIPAAAGWAYVTEAP